MPTAQTTATQKIEPKSMKMSRHALEHTAKATTNPSTNTLSTTRRMKCDKWHCR